MWIFPLRVAPRCNLLQLVNRRDGSWDPNTPQPMVFSYQDPAKKSQTMAGRKRVAEINTTKERVSLKSLKQTDNITLVNTSVAAKGKPVERSRRSSTEPFSGCEAAAENRCAGHND